MLKRGRACIQGHRKELLFIQLFMLLCWLIPIAAELFFRRLLPPTILWRTLLLFCSFLLNRVLLAPAHTGYYACCRRLAATGEPTAKTGEIENLRDEMLAPTLPSCFFWDYRHLLKSVKWQLRWDIFRLAVFAVCLFPALLFLAMGAGEEMPLLQAVCLGGGVLCGVVGLFVAFLVLLRVHPVLFLRPQYKPFWQSIGDGFKASKGHHSAVLFLLVKHIPFTVLFWCPFAFFRVFLLTEQAKIFGTAPYIRKPKRLRIFHTRVLRDA